LSCWKGTADGKSQEMDMDWDHIQWVHSCFWCFDCSRCISSWHMGSAVCPDIGSQRRYGAHPYPYAGSGSGLLSPGAFYRGDGRRCFCAFPHLLFFRESFFKKVADNEYEVDAMTDIETINKDLELNLPISEDYESLGGLIVTTTGKICEVGDEVQIDNIYLKVLEVDKMRVSKVFIRILEEVKEEE